MDLGRDKTIARILSRLQAAQPKDGPLKVTGTWGSFAHLLAKYLAHKTARPILLICPHIDDADNAVDDLHTFGAEYVDALAAWEGAEAIPDPTDEIRTDRLRLALKLATAPPGLIIAAPIQALCQPVPQPNLIHESSLNLTVNKHLSPEQTVRWLIDNGFERVDRVDLPGQFARRGGIVDIYAPLLTDNPLLEKSPPATPSQTPKPIRLEFFGDTIESIRQINLDTLRSTEQIETVSVVSVLAGSSHLQSECFINLLPPETIVVLEEPQAIQEVADLFLDRLDKPPRLYTWNHIYSTLRRFTRLHIGRFDAGEPADSLKLNISSVQQFQHKTSSLWESHKAALGELIAKAKTATTIYFYCETSAEIKRVTEIIRQSEKTLPHNFKLLTGFVHQGFVINSLNTIVISHHELFGQYALRRRQRPIRAAVPIDTLADLNPGDYVVHASYGIGKFLGIKTIKEKTGTSEYLTIKYADDVNIQVSVKNIMLVQKYIGTSPRRPNLSKVGSKRWQKQKQKVTKSVQSLAAEMLEVQAKRKALGGIAFPPDSNWQREFEQFFTYQETPDQVTAAEHIKADMHQPIAMDRLLCGDVGYGKTEIAMRAAFKAVENGKQVAVLVPTTVLSVQHARTFTERFADFPVCIEVLNRFRTPAQAADIIQRTKKGLVDVLIGTHRLLSGDVRFRDLGLLIIDEEQRFGVEHKEKLKKLRTNVDILTMTATPIPRTLHMSLLGLRDISSLATPPLDRRSIVTSVTTTNKELIRKAIIRELNRQGQVFFLHNRVKTIDKKAWEIQKLIEDTGAKVAVAHGRMPKSDLERAMLDFVTARTDVLVCTTIIESGLDIPNANTIFIDNADRFGLAELHQLRGRVGRYKHRAYAYLLLPPNRPVSPIAARRLKAIEEYSHLGAGFKIALRDLEIRGAGNILGPEQSGHIQLVGYQMYCELLADAVRRLKGQPAKKILSANLDLGFAASIPKNYIPPDRYRMDVYRKIALAASCDDLKEIETDLTDVYGPIPAEVQLLLQLARLRIAAATLGIKSIFASENNLVFSFTDNLAKKTERLFTGVKGRITVANSKTIYLHLDKNYLNPPTLLALLRKILTPKP